MNPADYRAADRAFLERVQSYAESPDAFRHRWTFRFRWSSWLVAAIMLVALGLVLGIGATLLSGRVLDRLLYGVKAADPLTLLAVALILFVIAIVASWIPARRAAGTDAMIALRAE